MFKKIEDYENKGKRVRVYQNQDVTVEYKTICDIKEINVTHQCYVYQAEIIGNTTTYTTFYKDEQKLVDIIEKELSIEIPVENRYRTYHELIPMYIGCFDEPLVIETDTRFRPALETSGDWFVKISTDSNFRIPRNCEYLGNVKNFISITNEGQEVVYIQNIKKGRVYADVRYILIVFAEKKTK